MDLRVLDIIMFMGLKERIRAAGKSLPLRYAGRLLRHQAPEYYCLG